MYARDCDYGTNATSSHPETSNEMYGRPQIYMLCTCCYINFFHRPPHCVFSHILHFSRTCLCRYDTSESTEICAKLFKLNREKEFKNFFFFLRRQISHKCSLWMLRWDSEELGRLLLIISNYLKKLPRVAIDRRECTYMRFAPNICPSNEWNWLNVGI